MKFKIGHISGELICADDREENGDPIIIKPNSVVELTVELLDAISYRLSAADFALLTLIVDDGGFLDLKPKKGK